jgi:hypothetical protein
VSPHSLVRRAAAALALLVCVLLPSYAIAQANPPPPGSWGAELESVATWLAAHKASRTCTDHCFVLTRLELTGAADTGMGFTLEGAVLADAPVPVPLFGPPTHARIDKVTENGKPAAVGFEGDHWYVVTAPGRFVVKGTLAIDGDLALAIPGPLDTLDAELSRGRVVEGAHLSGLQGMTVHFDRAATATPAAEPPVFQLSRAVRVGREITFEYHLVMRSGLDLGVVRLPLAYGEKVLDVQGSTGWNVQGTELVLPTAGRSASMVITGTLATVGTKFEPDARSSYEWWLVESDAEHRLTVAGDSRQVDASESPIARTQPSARLLLVGRGQHVEVTVQALVSTEVLAAVVRSHERTLVLTTRGDLVADDTLVYENNGIDWLSLPPTGRAVFLGTDGHAERVMRQSDDPTADVLVPLRVGSHNVRMQSVSNASIGALGGILAVPVPVHALTTSRAHATIGLPADVHPIAVLGGDRAWYACCATDGLALAVSIGIAIAALRGRTRRIVGAVALGGLWLASPLAWELVVGAGAIALAAWLSARLLGRAMRVVAWSGLALAAFILGIGSMRASSHQDGWANQHDLGGEITRGAAATVPMDLPVARETVAPAFPEPAPAQGQSVVSDGEFRSMDKLEAAKQGTVRADYGFGGAIGNFNGRLALGGITQGVAPVALTLPGYARSVTVSRELVTKERPFTPSVVYVTTTGLAPLVALWLVSVAWLAWAYRREGARLVRVVRERLARTPATHASDPVPAPPAPPPVVA